jgi:hypothetical protein
MEREFRISLPKRLSDILERLPEQGVGYQIVDVLLKNGEWMRQKVVLNCEILILKESEKVSENEIESISLHQRK